MCFVESLAGPNDTIIICTNICYTKNRKPKRNRRARVPSIEKVRYPAEREITADAIPTNSKTIMPAETDGSPKEARRSRTLCANDAFVVLCIHRRVLYVRCTCACVFVCVVARQPLASLQRYTGSDGPYYCRVRAMVAMINACCACVCRVRYALV